MCMSMSTSSISLSIFICRCMCISTPWKRSLLAEVGPHQECPALGIPQWLEVVIETESFFSLRTDWSAKWKQKVKIQKFKALLEICLESTGARNCFRLLSRSSGAHWDRELAVEVQQCPLWSGAGEEAGKRGGEEEEEGGGGAESYLKIKQPSPGRWGRIVYIYLP